MNLFKSYSSRNLIVTEIVVLKIFESCQRKSRSGLHSVVDLFSKEILPLIFSYNSPKFES